MTGLHVFGTVFLNFSLGGVGWEYAMLEGYSVDKKEARFWPANMRV